MTRDDLIKEGRYLLVETMGITHYPGKPKDRRNQRFEDWCYVHLAEILDLLSTQETKPS